MIPVKAYRLIEFYLKYHQKDIELNLMDYRKVLETLIILQNHWVESKIETPLWKVSLDALVSKAILHANTISYLMNGINLPNPINKETFNIIDFPSLYVLIRAQLENFLIIDYLYCQAKSDEEKEFRFTCWLYSGLLQRSKATSFTNELKEQQQKDKLRVVELKDLITSSKFYYSYLPDRDKRRTFIKTGNARLFNSWDDLIKFSNLNNMLLANYYSILSNHAHSEAIGIINFQDKRIGYHKNHPEGFQLLFVSQIFLSLVIKSFIKVFKILEIKYNMIDENTKVIIDMSASMGKNIAN
jgi:hypothetical protein